MTKINDATLILRRVRRELRSVGVSPDKIDLVVDHLKTPIVPCPPITKEVQLRMRDCMPKLGDRVTVVRTVSGFRVFSAASTRKMSRACHRIAPWKSVKTKAKASKVECTIKSAIKRFAGLEHPLSVAWKDPKLTNSEIAKRFKVSRTYLQYAAKGFKLGTRTERMAHVAASR